MRTSDVPGRRAAKSSGFALAYLALGLLLSGCPLNDRYYVDYSYGGKGESASGGTSNVDTTGGTTPTTGGSDAFGGDPSSGGITEVGAAPGEGGAPDGAGGTIHFDGGATSTGATGGTLGHGGSSESGGDTSSSGGASFGGTLGAGGIAPTGGTRTSGGAPGTGGSLASGGSPFQPLCGDEVAKGNPCDQSSAQFCYKTCGPNSVGYKSETCQLGSYVEQTGCTFPPGQDYSCYELPAQRPAQCPAGVPRATQACSVPECTVCFGGTLGTPLYQDSTGTQKVGYCVCTESGVWTCASTSAWPCPGGAGCTGP